MMQNSGLGNAVSPLTSLTWTFRLPQLLIVTWRGQPGVPDEPQHELMGAITPGLLDTMQIPWEFFPAERAEIGPALDRAVAHMDESGRPFALLMRKGSVAAYPLAGDAGVKGRLSRGAAQEVDLRHGGPNRPSRREVLEALVAGTPSDTTAVLASTGFCGRELYAIADRPNHLYMVGSMGCIAPLALGFALGRPDVQVIALDGDGAALMRLGSMATVGAYGPANLRHLLLDNGAHESTGGQATVSPLIGFGQIAAACGYASSLEADDVGGIADWVDHPPPPGPGFARCLIRTGIADTLPRPKLSPAQVKTRFMVHFSATIGD